MLNKHLLCHCRPALAAWITKAASSAFFSLERLKGCRLIVVGSNLVARRVARRIQGDYDDASADESSRDPSG
jgi:hypothetical protein